jgi:phenylpyruvate tautomerase PptA (4-oxalocrotonate tautomerase family)
MPYLRLHCPELPAKQKKRIAKELTAVTMRVFRLPGDFPNRCTLQFMPFRLEDLAVGGKLLSEGGDPDYYLEVSHSNLKDEQKRVFVAEVTPLLARLLNLESRSWLARLLRITDPPLFRISILFNQYDDGSLAVGGRFNSEGEGRDNIVAKLVEDGRAELVASKAAENGF